MGRKSFRRVVIIVLLTGVLIGLRYVPVPVAGGWYSIADVTANLVHPPYFVAGNPRPGCREPRLPSQYPSEEVTLRTSDGLALEGYFLPAEGRPAVLLLHGNGNCKADMDKHAQYLRPAGYAVLAFDFRGQGNSEGVFVSWGRQEMKDVRAALDFLLQRGHEEIAVIGASLGGGVAILAAAHFQEINAVVVDAGFSDVTGMIRHQVGRAGRRLPSFAWTVARALVQLDATLRYRMNYFLQDPVDHIANVAPRPMLIIHGELDTIIPVTQARRNVQNAGEGTELWILEGHYHTAFLWREVAGYRERVLGFLAKAFS